MKKNIENELPKIRVKLRDDKPLNAEGKYTLNYLVRFEGKTIKKPTGLYIEEKNWNKKKETVLGSTNELLRIQGILDGKKSDFNQYFLNYDATGGQINRKIIDDYFENKRFDDFFSYYKGAVDKRKELSNVTLNKYKLCSEILKKYCKKNKIQPLRFNDLRLGFLQDFDTHLVFFLKLSSDTANNYHKCLKYVLNQAVLDGIINRSPYLGFKPHKTNSRKKVIPLTSNEIEKVLNVEIPENRQHLEKIKDYFEFILNTGLRYSDLFNVKVENILKSGNENQRTLKIIQEKTKNPLMIPLNVKANEIINKYIEFYGIESGFVFPKLTNQVFNRQLKDLAELAEIDKSLNCHLGRHTFATRLRKLNVSLEDVSELLGHTDVKMTKLYAKTDFSKLSEAVSLL
jgi:site-specific recombinase XerD